MAHSSVHSPVLKYTNDEYMKKKYIYIQYIYYILYSAFNETTLTKFIKLSIHIYKGNKVEVDFIRFRLQCQNESGKKGKIKGL